MKNYSFLILLLFSLNGIGQNTYWVNTTDDWRINTNDPTVDRVCDEVHCSLREAINAANQDNGPSFIYFNIPGNGPFTILMDEECCGFPVISEDNLVIDATTQPNWYPGIIELKKPEEGNYTRIITNESHSFELYGLAINCNFIEYGEGIRTSGNSIIIGEENKGNHIYNCNEGIVSVHSSFGGPEKSNNFKIIGNTFGFNPVRSELQPNNTGIYLATAGGRDTSYFEIGSINEGGSNIFFSKNYGIRTQWTYTNGVIKNNYFGINVDNTISFSGETGIHLSSFYGDSGLLTGHKIGGVGLNEKNKFFHQKTGVFIDDEFSNDRIAFNEFYKNHEGITIFDGVHNQGSILNPSLNYINENLIIGQGVPESKIYVFHEVDFDENFQCQGGILLDSTVVDANGEWSINTPLNLILGDVLNVIEINKNNVTSEFSPCYTLLPDDCKYAEPLPVNNQACSSMGIVLDLKQLTTSSSAPNSNCSSTFAGNDAWYKIAVPETGNFLIRTNISNTVVPVIEIYTDCGNTALPECMVLDSTPYVMVFENYAPNDTLYLRVWDKDNTIVNSVGSALLHLTAHELAINKTDWEICDYENLINDNPTNLIRREANTFILSYDAETLQNTIEQDSIAFTDMMEMELKKSCNCGGAPLQLWSTESPVDLDGRKRYAKSRGSVDTTNYNYIFETVEFQVNSYAIGQQYDADIAIDSNGNFAMVWKDEQRRHNYGRVYLNSGNPVSVEFPIGASDKTQYSTDISMFDNGDFITVWHEIDVTQYSDNFEVYGRQFYANGTAKGPVFNISTISANTYFHPTPKIKNEFINHAKKGTNAKVGIYPDGNFIVVWQVGSNIFIQHFDESSNLIGSIIKIGNIADNGGGVPNFTFAFNSSNKIIISWKSINTDEIGIYAQQFNSNGLALGNTFLVNTTENKNQNNPDIALAEDGSFIITWQSYGQVDSESDYDIYAQRFDANANKIGNEFLVNSYTTDAQTKPSISLFDNGNFLIAWSSLGQDGFAEGIYAKLFDANGNPIAPSFDDSDKGSVGEEFRMNTYNEPQQDKPKTATNGNNIFMGAWEDGANDGSYEGIFAQRYETIEVDNTHIFYPIGTATPSTLMGDEMPYPTATYHPGTSVKKAKVAILDTGIDHSHALIQNAIWQNPEVNDGDNCLIGDDIGYDFVNRTGTPIDLDGHGTQVSGILTRNFDTAVKLELMDLKFHELEKGNVFDAICGIYYAVDNGADVINLSWGFEASEEPVILKKALQYASDKDVLIVTTAGNTSKNNDNINKYPANLDIPNMIVVTAYQYKNSTGEIKLANYASHGKNNVDIAAYGYVETAKRGGQKALAAGTSLAAPAVARTAATIKGLYPVLTATEIKDCILSTVESVASLTNKVATGGILDHDAALACAQTKAEMVINTACLTSGLIVNANSTGACNATEGAIDLIFSGNDPNPKFLWSTGDTTQNLNNLSIGNYSVTVTDNERCEQTLDITITNDCEINCQTNLVMNGIDMNDGIYRSDNTITSSGIIELDSNVVFKAAESITLNDGFHAKRGSQFTAIIEACENSLTEPILENRTNLVIKKVSNLKVKVYPNPTQNLLNVEVNKSDQGFYLELYDVMGRQLSIWKTEQNQMQLSVEELTSGIYFLRIDKSIVEKFVVGQK